MAVESIAGGLFHYEKPCVKLLGEDGNIYNLLGIVQGVMRRKHLTEAFNHMRERVYASHSYTEALSVIMEYVTVV